MNTILDPFVQQLFPSGVLSVDYSESDFETEVVIGFAKDDASPTAEEIKESFESCIGENVENLIDIIVEEDIDRDDRGKEYNVFIITLYFSQDES